MNYEEAIETLRQIADEALDDLNRNRRQYTATRRIEALNVAIGALHKQRERERMNDPKNEWISVKDRLPEESGLYLIIRNGEVAAAYRQTFLFFGNVWNNDMHGSFSIIPEEEVTHWRPVPEAPKEGGQNNVI